MTVGTVSALARPAAFIYGAMIAIVSLLPSETQSDFPVPSLETLLEGLESRGALALAAVMTLCAAPLGVTLVAVIWSLRGRGLGLFWLGMGLFALTAGGLVAVASRAAAEASDALLRAAAFLSTDHALAYAVLGFSLSLASLTRRDALLMGSCACLLGTGLEGLQLYVPGRSANVFDLSANFAGLALGFVVGRTCSGPCCDNDRTPASPNARKVKIGGYCDDIK